MKIGMFVERGRSIIPNCGHWATDEQPAWIAERVLRFLSTSPRSMTCSN